MEILRYLTLSAKTEPTNDYERGKQTAFKYMISMYKLFSKSYDRTLSSIYFFAYTKKTEAKLKELEDDFSRGKLDAYTETFERFRPKRPKREESEDGKAHD